MISSCELFFIFILKHIHVMCCMHASFAYTIFTIPLFNARYDIWHKTGTQLLSWLFLSLKDRLVVFMKSYTLMLSSLCLSGHQTHARPNSASEALWEGAIDPGWEQSWPGIWAWSCRVRWTSSGSRVGLPLYWNFCQEQDNGGWAFCRDCPTDELFHAAGEAGTVLHSLCGSVRKRYEHCCFYPL